MNNVIEDINDDIMEDENKGHLVINSSGLKQNFKDCQRIIDEIELDEDEDTDLKIENIEKIEDKIKEYISEIEKRNEIIKTYENEAVRARAENSSLKNQMEKSQMSYESYIQLQQKLVQMQEAEVPNRDEIIRLRKFNESLQNKCIKLTDESNLDKEQFHTQYQDAKDSRAILEDTIKELKSKLRNSSLDMEAIQHENDSLKVELDSNKQEKEKLQRQEHELTSNIKEIVEKMDNIKTSQNRQISQLKEQIQSLTSDLKTTKGSLQLSRTEHEKSCKDLQRAEQQRNLFNLEFKQKEEQLIATHNEELFKIEILDAELVKSRNQLAELTQQFDNQSAKWKCGATDLQRKDEELTATTILYESSQEELIMAKQKVSELLMKETELSEKLSRSSNDLVEVQSANISLRENSIQKEQKIEQLTDRLAGEAALLEQLKCTLSSVEKERDCHKLQLDEAHQVGSQYSTNIDELKEQQKDFQGARDEFEKTLARSDADCQSLREKCNSALLTITELSERELRSRTELSEKSAVWVSDMEGLSSQNETLTANISKLQQTNAQLTSSLDSERVVTEGLKLELTAANECSQNREEFLTSVKAVQLSGTDPEYMQLSDKDAKCDQHLRDEALKNNLTSWVHESKTILEAVINCLNEATAMSKVDNFIVPITYSFETGHEHVTRQISVLFEALLGILKKYQSLAALLKTSFNDESVTTEVEELCNEENLLQLLATELEMSSCLSSNVGHLKNLVEMGIFKIIMQKPAPILREREIFNVVHLLTSQLLQYFSLSQKKDRSRKVSNVTPKDDSLFDFTSVNFVPEKTIHADLEFSFDDCAQDLSISSFSMDPDCTKSSNLESIMCPHLIKALKGNVDSVDVDALQQEAKCFQTSLEAAIGLMEAQLLSKEKNSSLAYLTLKELEVPEEERMKCLHSKLEKEQQDNEDLRQKLHQLQGLLNGAREESLAVAEEKNRLEEYVCELSQKIENLNSCRETKEEVHMVLTNEGQDLQKVIRDSKDKVKTLMAGKKKKHLEEADLISMNEELENILQKVLSESERSFDQLLSENIDLSSQLQAAERKIYANKRFIDEQISERDKEAEILQKSNEDLQKALKGREAHEEIYATLNEEVDSLQKELMNRDTQLQSEIACKEEINGRLGASLKKIDELRGTIDNLEVQVTVKFRDEERLREEIASLKEELKLSYKQRRENVFESGFEDNFSEGNKYSDDEQPARKVESPNFGPSAMEELGFGRYSVMFETTLGIKRLESLLEKVEKAVASNINCSRTSISHCSEEDISAKDTIDTSATLNRSLSPNSWECKLDEKLASFELHIETLLKQNSDLGMQLQIAKKECEEIGAENDTNIKQLEAIKESLSRDTSETERKSAKLLQEANSEKEELQKKYSANLLKISSLQTTIDEAKRVPLVDDELLNRLTAMQTKLASRESMLSVKVAKVNELTYEVKELKSILALREEEIKKLNSLKATDNLPLGTVSKSLESRMSEGSSNYSEILRRDPATRNTSIISEPSKTIDFRSSKDTAEVRYDTTSPDVTVVEPKYTQQRDQEFVALEFERNKLQELSRLVDEKNAILIRDIELLTDEKLELESKLVHATYEIQAKGTLANILKDKSAKEIAKIKDDVKGQIDSLNEENDDIKSTLEREKSVSASLIKNLCEKDKQIRNHQNDICELEEKHKKQTMDSEQLMFEKFTTQMQEFAENLNKEKLTQIQELEENYKELLSRQEENYRMNISQGSCQETILNLTLKDLEKLKSKKMLRKVYREGLAILSLTEAEKVHSSLLDFSALSDSSTSLDASRDLSIGRESHNQNNYKALCTYLEDKLSKLEADKSALNAEIFAERLKHVELLKEKGASQFKFDRLERQLQETEKSVQLYKSEVEDIRGEMDFLQDQLLLENSNRRKLRLAWDLDKKSATENEQMQDEVIKELKCCLEKERLRMLELVDEIGSQSTVDNLYEKSIDNVFIDISDKENDLQNEAATRQKTEILRELEEAKFKVEELNQQLNSLHLENNLLLSKVGHKRQKVAFPELKIHKVEKARIHHERGHIKAPRSYGDMLDVPKIPSPSFRGEEISLRKTVAGLQAKVEGLEREKQEMTSEAKASKHFWEMVSMEKQEIVDLFRKLYESQADKESLRIIGVNPALKYLTQNKVETKVAATNTDAVSYDKELKMYLTYTQYGRQQNRTILWNLVVSREQLKGYQKALVFQKEYLLRRLRESTAHDDYVQNTLTTLANRAFQLGDLVQRGTQTTRLPRRNRRFRVYVYTVITIIRIRAMKKLQNRTMHHEYFMLIKAIKSDELCGSESEPGIVRPNLSAHTPPTKDTGLRSSALVATSKRSLFTHEDVTDEVNSGILLANKKLLYDI